MSKKLTDMTRAELLAEGFGDWDGEMVLIPKARLDEIPDMTLLVSINGRNVVKGRDYIDLDTRAGFLAYGWTPKK